MPNVVSSDLYSAMNRDVAVVPITSGIVELRGRTGNFQVDGTGAIAVVEQLTQAPTLDDETRRIFCDVNGGHFIDYLAFMFDLGESGLVDRVLMTEGVELGRLISLAPGIELRSQPLSADQRYRLSRFAFLRRIDNRLVIESPLGSARVELSDPLMTGMLQLLASGTSALSAATVVPGLDRESALGALALLDAAQAIAPIDSLSDALDEEEHPLGWWEFHDLLFHSRSRLGRHGGRYGGTFHRRGKAAPPELLPDWPISERIQLRSPALAIDNGSPSFDSVLRQRRSIRDYGDVPIDVGTLGDFLHRSARVQQVFRTGPDDMDYSLRPHPGGGAIHELSLYPVVASCDGLERGIYRYDPLAHELLAVQTNQDDLEQLLELAWITGDRKSRPQVHFVITANFQRLQWKYESIVYAVILKNVGALYQTMYLTATAMNLAPCALGGGHSDLFGRAVGLKPYGEAAVGEFLLGSRCT